VIGSRLHHVTFSPPSRLISDELWALGEPLILPGDRGAKYTPAN